PTHSSCSAMGTPTGSFPIAPARPSPARTGSLPMGRALFPPGRPLFAVFLRGFGRLGRRRACRFGFTRSRSGSGSRDFADLIGLDPLLGGHVPSKTLQTEVVFVGHGFPTVLLAQLALPGLHLGVRHPF